MEELVLLFLSLITRKGKTAYLDSSTSTVRHMECQYLIFRTEKRKRCKSCDDYRLNLHSLASREKQKATNAITCNHTNYRYLPSPEKTKRLHDKQQENRSLKKRINNLEEKIAKITDKEGVDMDDETSHDIYQMVQDEQSVIEKLPDDSFQSIFWRQQREAAEKHPKAMRWHPLMIQWCLYLRHISSN
uniref:Uncharacterized protein n=1 Tax=Amphimedon queenslandica TaxID=400682 RepID=A0A1X7UPQ6_AMPQE